MTDIHKVFCQNLSAFRNERGFTQEMTAEKLNIGIRAYQKIEYGYKTGTSWPSPDRLRSLAKIMKCDTLDFFKPLKKN